METEGCPLGSHPANLADNAACVLCFTCEAACPHRSVEFRLRPPAADIWNFGHQESVAELCLMFMLLGAVAVHHLPVVAAQLGLSAEFISSNLVPHEGLAASFLSWHALATAALLAAPAGFVWGVDFLWRAAHEATARSGSGSGSGTKSEFAALLASASSSSSSSSSSSPSSSSSTTTTTATTPPAFLTRLPPRLTRVAYAYLPLTWAATLAHYEEWGLREAGTVARVFARSLEDASLLPHSLAELVPAPAADPAVVDFLQGATLLVGARYDAALLLLFLPVFYGIFKFWSGVLSPYIFTPTAREAKEAAAASSSTSKRGRGVMPRSGGGGARVWGPVFLSPLVQERLRLRRRRLSPLARSAA